MPRRSKARPEAIPVEAKTTGADNGGDDARGGVDATDPVIEGVGDVEVVIGVDGEAGRAIEPGIEGRALIADATAGAGSRAGEMADPAIWMDDPDAVEERVGQVDVAFGIGDDGTGQKSECNQYTTKEDLMPCNR